MHTLKNFKNSMAKAYDRREQGGHSHKVTPGDCNQNTQKGAILVPYRAFVLGATNSQDLERIMWLVCLSDAAFYCVY